MGKIKAKLFSWKRLLRVLCINLGVSLTIFLFAMVFLFFLTIKQAMVSMWISSSNSRHTLSQSKNGSTSGSRSMDSR